ncbi:hypothetical protein FACS189499_04070 [Clostridia bacterium]|nr:hypothetical protein FACS189499_04070 [Clostridia bacterium]
MKKIHGRKNIFKKVLTMLLSSAIIITSMGSLPIIESGAAGIPSTVDITQVSASKRVYNHENYKVTYEFSENWDKSKSVSLTITNTGKTAIENWMLGFKIDDNNGVNGEVKDIWGGTSAKTSANETYIKNTGYNADIQPGQSVNIGYSLKNPTADFPDEIFFVQSRKEVKAENFKTTLKTTSSWDGNLNAEIKLENLSNSDVEGWNLSFTSNFEIKNSWVADFEKVDENSYIIKAKDVKNLAKKSSVTLSLECAKADATPKISDVKLTEAAADYNVNSDKTKDDKDKSEIDYETDTDSDGLSDFYEELLGTDPENPDTDGDELPDGYEAFVSNSDPLKKDSDLDSDNDGLTNLEEYKAGSNPLAVDTDEDGLSDYDEVKIHKSNPAKTDTDDDGLPDNLEIEYGMNPTKPSTKDDGILDGNRVFNIVEAFDGKTENNIAKPTIDIDLKGSQIESLEIEAVSSDDVFLNPSVPGYVDSAFDFHVDGAFSKATMTFEINNSLFSNPDFKPAIYYFNPETQLLEQLPNQTVSGNKVSADVEHFSTYVVLNSFEFDEFWEKQIEEQKSWNAPLIPDLGTAEATGEWEIAFLIQASSSMNIDDAERKRIAAAKKITEYIPDGCRVIVWGYDNSLGMYTKFTDDMDKARTALNSVSNYGNKNFYVSLYSAIYVLEDLPKDRKRAIVLFSDGYDSPDGIIGKNGLYTNGYNNFGNDPEGVLDNLKDRALKNNINVHVFQLRDSKMGGSNEDILKNLASTTKGVYNKNLDPEVLDGVLGKIVCSMQQFSNITRIWIGFYP